MRRGLFSLMLIVILTGSMCRDISPVGPDGSVCQVRNGAEVCAAQAEYRQRQTVVFTTRNTTGVPLYKDACSTKLVGVTALFRPFEERYEPFLRCGPGATQADIVANMIEIAPGESVEESLQLSAFALQGFWRVNVWILNADGTLAANRPSFSGIFRVFPSTSR